MQLIKVAVAWWRTWLLASPGRAMDGVPGWLGDRYAGALTAFRRHPTVVDTVLAIALAAATMPQIVSHARHGPGPTGEYVLFSALLVSPLIWRRRFPLSVFAFAAAVALAQWIIDLQLAADVALLVYLYTVATRYPLRVGVLTAAAVEVGALLASLRWSLTSNRIESLLLLTGPTLTGLLLGVTVRNRRGSLAALMERAAHLERERDQQARIAAAAERTRIAREMHDVIAHSLAVIVTLSEGAALKQAREPRRAAEAMRQVSITGHQALDEMRRLLGVLRNERASYVRQPQPGLAQLDDLFAQVRATGLAAELTTAGTPTALPPGAELTVYRIVQEALTNTLKHAANPTRISAAIVYRLDSVTIDVHDDGGVPARPREVTTTHGLTGMSERAAVYDGTVNASPDPIRGWHVHAHLPITANPPNPNALVPATPDDATLTGRDR